jgi:predicted secreted protein
LPSSFTGAASPTATAVCQIVGELRLELSLAASLRRHDFPAAESSQAAFDAELARTADALAAVETGRALRSLHGPDWRRLLPETARRLEPLVWLDILDAEDDPVRLAAALDRHYGEQVAA